MKNKLIVVFAAIISSCMAFAGASEGSCVSKATSLSLSSNEQTKDITLVDEWDPEEKENWGTGVYYCKVKVSKYQECTIWITGASSEDVSLDVDTDFDDENAPMASFDTDWLVDGTQVAVMESESWDEDDPSSGTYYVCITGEIGNSCTLHYQEGVKEFSLPGSDEDSAVSLSIADKWQDKNDVVLWDGVYYFKAELEAGRGYRFRTTGGKSSAHQSVTVYSYDDDWNEKDDLEFVSRTNDVAVIITPVTGGLYYIELSGEDSTASLSYCSQKAKPIGEHDAKDLSGSVSFVPGRINADPTGTWGDDIIDEYLFKLTMKNGERKVFKTAGAATNIMMRIYDKSGKTLATAESTSTRKDLCVGVEATYDGVYYVGVCNPELGVSDQPTGSAITLTAVTVAPTTGEPDRYDFADDTPAGAYLLVDPKPAFKSDSPLLADLDGSDIHKLNENDWVDTFKVVNCRKGLSYGFKVSLPEDRCDLNLAAEVFTWDGKKETRLNEDKGEVKGSLSPNADGYLSFKAPANGTYYVRIWVAEGKGNTYPAYKLHTMVFMESGAPLGYIQVNLKPEGVGGWTLGSEKTQYKSGDKVLVSGTVKVSLVKVTGFSAVPATTNVNITGGTEATVVNGIYTDKYDPKDDVEKTATSLSVSSKPKEYARTLFAEDLEDNFSFSAKVGTYYNFVFTNLTGDAKIQIKNTKNSEIEFDGATGQSVQKWSPKASAKYILKVTHGEEPKQDGAYTLVASSANVGAIKFASKSYTAKADTGYVDIKVNRTAKEGRVRALIGTAAGTAKPGVDYCPMTNVLDWAAGDNKARTVRIVLLPNVQNAKNDKSGLTFTVQLKPYEGELEPGEYRASVQAPDVVTVKMTGHSKAAAEKTIKQAQAGAKSEDKVPTAAYTGTFTGLLQAQGGLTNGLPELASVTFTASEKVSKDVTTATLSAKVIVAGKTYTFKPDSKDKAWDANPANDGRKMKTFYLVTKVNKVSYTNSLTVTVNGLGNTADSWRDASGEVSLTLNVPDAKGKAVQPNIAYAGEIYRNNAKNQQYLDAVYAYAGYYTAALCATNEVGEVPGGNGYLTLTIDAKGGVKVGGLLADGTKVSVSSTVFVGTENGVCGSEDVVGIPVFLAKSPYCFGGVLYLKSEGGKRLVDTSASWLIWNNDNAALTPGNLAGWSCELIPAGGFYNTVKNVQGYYLTDAFSVQTEDLPGYLESVQPDGTVVNVYNDTLSVDKRVLTKGADKLNDWENCTNPNNVQIKFTRATGLVSGSFALWTQTDSKGKVSQKETTFKHAGVALFDRDEDSFDILPENVWSAGYFLQPVSVKVGNKTRKYSLSHPFNVIRTEVNPERGSAEWYTDWSK